MKRRKQIDQFSEQEIRVIFKTAYCLTDVANKMNLPENGRTGSALRTLIETFKIDISHFNKAKFNAPKIRKFKRIAEGKATYLEICWQHHKKECVICGEKLIVEAHHFNDDHNDNRPENFVPLCPTHHKYWHSSHRHLILKQVNDYVEKFTINIGMWRSLV